MPRERLERCEVCGVSSKHTPLFEVYGEVRCGPRRCEAFVPVGKMARAMKVNPKTVSRWADRDKLEVMRTIGGHRRVRARVGV